MTRVAGYINVVALALCLFMLVSFAVLPAEKTRRHYLNVCLLIGIVFLELGFIVPWAKRPKQCYDAITPNDMHSSMICAWGGVSISTQAMTSASCLPFVCQGLVIFGGVAVNMWSTPPLSFSALRQILTASLVLIRAFSMHLQICWDIVPGRLFFWVAQVLGWAVSVVLLSTELTLAGVSFRFGDYCHVNHTKSLESLWGPLLGLAGVSLILQFATFTYCLNVYLKHSFVHAAPDTESSRGKSSAGSTRSVNARIVCRRVKKVVSLQWRGLAIAVLVVADVIFFSLVFVVLDSQTQHALSNSEVFLPWLSCIVIEGGDKNKCLDLAAGFVVDDPLLIATLILLAVVGIEAFVLICRVEMVTGWVTLAKTVWKTKREKREFVSLDAHQLHGDMKTYELRNISPSRPTIAEPDPTKPRADLFNSPVDQEGSPILFEKTIERSYRNPTRSFSNPRPPVSRARVSWDFSDASAQSRPGHPTIIEK